MNRLLYIIFIAMLASCNPTKMTTGSVSDQAPVVVYKTKPDYYRNVPVTLNEAGDRVVSYPAPSDLSPGGEPALPVKLKKGYLLDQRGIGARSAFTAFTYDEYSGMEAAPSLQELFDSIIDDDPFESIWLCGKRGDYKELTKELNQKIRKGFPGCIRLTD